MERAGIAAAADRAAVRDDARDIFLLLRKQAAQHSIRMTPTADEISDRRQSRHPNRLRFAQAAQRIAAQIRTVLDGFHARLQRRANCSVAVGVRHDGKAALVRKKNHLPNVLGCRPGLGQAAEFIEID